MKFTLNSLILCLMFCCNDLNAQTRPHEFPLDTTTHLASARRFPYIGRIDIAQNYPNPFSTQSFTTIRFKAIDVFSAQLVIYSPEGEIFQIIKLEPGVGEVVLKGEQLTAGLYMYALMVNGRRMAIRRMLVLDNSIGTAQ